MKKFLALILLLAITGLPTLTYAIGLPNTTVGFSDPTDLPNATNQPADTSGTATPTSNATQGCQNNNSGGALGGMTSQLLGSLVNKLVPGGQAGSILQSLLSGGGGNLNVGSLIGQLTGSGQAGQLIGSLLSGSGSLSGVLSGGLQSLLGGSGLGGLLGGSGLGGLLGGSGLGSLLGGIPGVGQLLGAIGLGEVPVTDSTTHSNIDTSNSHLKVIHSDQDTQLQVTCVDNVLVRKAATDFAAKHAETVIKDANTGNGGGPRYVQNISEENATLANTVHEDNVNNVLPQLITGNNAQFLQYTQQQTVARFQEDTDPATKFKCPLPDNVNIEACLEKFSQCGSDYNSQIQNWATINTDSRCNPKGLATIAVEYDKATQAGRVADRNQFIAAGNSIIPPTTCTDKGADANTPDYKCRNYKVTAAAAVTTRTITDAVALGAEKQAHANEIGNLVDSLFAQLAQTALTSLTGMLGLSQSQNGQSSYLNQLSGNTAADTLATNKTALKADIESSIGVEVAYESVLNDEIMDLQSEKSAFATQATCYAGLTIATVGTGTTTPQMLATQASTTISSVILPLIDQKNTAVSDSENVISQLNAYDTQVQTAQTVADINALSNAYQALVTSGALHTTTDLNLATADRDASKTTFAVLLLGLASTQCPVN